MTRESKSFSYSKKKKSHEKGKKEDILTSHDLPVFYSMECNAGMRCTRNSLYLSFQGKNHNMSLKKQMLEVLFLNPTLNSEKWALIRG